MIKMRIFTGTHYPSKAIAVLTSFGIMACAITAHAAERSSKVRNDFKKLYACPSTGLHRGACPGYVIDHIIALNCGGADDVRNMQYQTTEEGKKKDKWERNGETCDRQTHGEPPPPDNPLYPQYQQLMNMRR